MSVNRCWRLEAGLVEASVYKKRFALLPKVCTDGTRVWFESYFNKYITWNHPHAGMAEAGHTDFIESITEEEYIIRKLAETL